MANFYLAIVLGLLVLSWLLELVVEWLNLKHVRTDIPEEFQGVYDSEKYATSQRYLRDRTRFGLISGTVTTVFFIGFILLGGFAWLDGFASGIGWGPIPTGLVFGGGLMLLSTLIGLPASLYSTFVIEERYGFNKTTPKTFVIDQLKGLVLGAIIGGLVFALVLWFFYQTNLAWLYAWIAVIVIQLVIMYVAPVWIMPLFNKFEPLEDGDLKHQIENYAHDQQFALDGIFTMDGSKRSTKSNAYFTGFGKMRRIVLFDTLVEKHSVSELVSVLAHEVGHYKLKHIHKMLIISILSTGLMFFILSLFLSQAGLYEAFGVRFAESKIYAGMVFFGFLYAPISLVFGIVFNMFSRKHEFEADAFAAETAKDPGSMIEALKKLSVDSLSNLTPHPLKVFLEYSHPPVTQRIQALRKIQGT